jgi:hypothetical protein
LSKSQQKLEAALPELKSAKKTMQLLQEGVNTGLKSITQNTQERNFPYSLNDSNEEHKKEDLNSGNKMGL